MGDGPPSGLSERETEVQLLADPVVGKAAGGEELHLSPVTHKRHPANIYQKIGVRSRNDAVRKAIVEQWIGIHEITSSAATADGTAPRAG